MNSATPPGATGEKSILLLANVYSRDKHEISRFRNGYNHAWFIIQHAVNGRPQIFKIFNDLPQTSEYEDLKNGLWSTSCALVGSSLCVIGGGTLSELSDYNGINSLDTRNCYDGWKNHKLPFRCNSTVTAVYGDFIYIFPGENRFVDVDLKEYGDNKGRRGYVYDMKNRRSYMIGRIPSRSPPKNGWHTIRVCAALNGPNRWGVLVAVDEDDYFYLHDPLMNKWTVCNEYDPLPKSKIVSDNHYARRSFATSNGKLYILDLICKSQTRFHIYDTVNGKLLFSDFMSEFDELETISCPYDRDQVHLVPVADDTVCFLWYNEKADSWEYPGSRKAVIHYLKGSFSYDPVPVFHVVDRAGFLLETKQIINCLPFDPCPDQMKEIAPPTPKQTVDDDDAMKKENRWRFVNSRVLMLATEAET